MSELSRGEFIGASAATGAATTVAQAGGGRTVQLKVRWYGGGVYELAPPDDKQIVLVDAWIWNNTGFNAFGMQKPAELSSPAAYAAHLKSRKPEAVIVALTHDHGDHMGDFFQLLKTLEDAGIDVKAVGQGDLMRVGLVPKFKEAGLDYTKVVLNNGNGINLGGAAVYKGVRIEAVPAVHSTTLGYPPVGFIIDIAGTRVYASGDTDLYGDLAMIARRYQPVLGVICTGNGAFTMGPEDAATAVSMVGVSHAVPVHYAHNPLVVGPQCGDIFKSAVGRTSPRTAVTVMRPGQSATLTLPAAAAQHRTTPFG